MIKYNNNTIYNWNFDTSNLIKVYRNNAIVFYKVSGESPTPEYKVCFAVVDDIYQYTDMEFEDVYDNATEKWYKLNNLNEYEEYGVYGSGRTSCGGSSRLPQGYTEVEYIENTSTAYIDTGFKPNQDTRITLTAQTVTSQASGKLIGSGAFNKTNAMQFCYEPSSTGSLVVSWGTVAGWTTYSSCIGDYNIHTYDWNKNEFYRDDTLVDSVTYANFQCTDNLGIFRHIQAGDSPSSAAYFKGKIFSFKIFDNGTLVRDFVPCKKDNDEKYGMYDIVNDVFYVSPNNVDFSGGEPVTPTDCVTTYEGKLTIDEYTQPSRLPSGYTEVEYIENTSTAYINTEVLLYDSATNSYEIETKMSSTWGGGEFEYLLATEGTSTPYNGLELRWNTHYQSGGELQCESVPKNVTYSNIDNGDGTSAITISCTSTNATNNVPLSLFCGIWSSGPWRNGKGKIYDLKITKNDVFVRDLVPAKRDSDNKYGLYDLVTDTFYVSPNGNNFVGGSEVNPPTTTYEFIYSGGSWVNVGEVSGSTATLPNVEFMLNYNAKNYNSSTYSISKTEGQLKDVDAVCNYGYHIVDHSSDGYVSVTGNSRMLLSGTTYMGRNNTQTGCTMTVVSKARTTSGYSVFTNRGGTSPNQMNWMWRYPSNGIILHGSSRYNNPLYFTSTTNTPIIASIKTYYDNGVKQQLNDWTNNGSYSGNFEYGTEYNGNSSLFCDYSNHNSEFWQGDFYWIYMSQEVLSDEEIQQVIDYNEGGGQSEYPKYYSEKSDPLDDLVFTTMEDAQTYAYNNCVYDGMHATIDGDRYYFDSSDENGWVKILEYYKVEDVTSGGASGWTISGSSTYNPDSSYYDDFDLETTSTSSSYKIAKVTIYGYDHFTYYLRTSGYSSWCYVVATNVDEIQTPPTSMSYNSASAITSTYGFTKAPKSAVNLSNYRRVTYNNLDKTVEHTFYVYFYGQTFSSYVGNATILIPKEQTNENWEQVTFSASSNVASSNKNLYIDNNNSTSGGTSYWYNRWMIGLPSGSHSSYTNYSNYDYCPNTTSSTFTSVASEQRQVNFTYDGTTSKTLSFRLVDGSGNVLAPSDTVYYNMALYNSCNVQSNNSNSTFPRSQYVKVGGSFVFSNSSNRHYIYGYQPPTFGTRYYTDNYPDTFDIVYTKLSEEAVTITYTTYDPDDSETPAFKTDITYPYNGGTTSSTTLTSYDVPYTYPYEVSQTSNKFSANSQSYTASQAARTINFTLYPNNREFATVADLEDYGYAWEGMTAYVGSDKYVYQNGEWVYNPSRLPSGYQEVEYIQNTASGSNSSSTSRLAIKFEDSITNNESAYTYEITCLIDTGNISAYWDFCGNPYVQIQKTDSGYGYKFEPRAWGKNFNGALAGQFYNNIKYKLRIYQGTSYPMLEVTNITAETTNAYSMTSTRSGMKNNSVKFGLFNFYNELDSGAHLAPGKVYSLKIYDKNNTLIADAVPCVRTSDNKCGFYNLARNEFEYDASGNLTLTAGPNVN